MSQKIYYNQSDYEDVLFELNNIKFSLEFIDDQMNGIGADLEDANLGVNTNQAMVEQVDNMQLLASKNKEEIENMINIIDELIEVAQRELKPENKNSQVEIDIDQVKDNCQDIINLVNTHSQALKEIIMPSTDMNNYIVKTDKELKDGLIEAVLNPKDERRQKKAEQVYDHNKKIMNQLNESLKDTLTFRGEIDAIEDLIKIFNNFENVFDSILQDLNGLSLYDNIIEQRIGVVHISSIDTSVQGYHVEYIHNLLSVVGLWPGLIGIVADIINGAIYFIQGDPKSAIISFLGIIPFGKLFTKGSSAAMQSVIKDLEGVFEISDISDIWKVMKDDLFEWLTNFDLSESSIDFIMNFELDRVDGSDLFEGGIMGRLEQLSVEIIDM